MNILSMIFHAARPSRQDDMKAVAMPRFIRRGYDGLTFFGHIITHTQEEANAFNAQFDAMKNHEMIHLYQARSTHDSWWVFYALYSWYWLRGTCSRIGLKNAGYLLNPFELEAYGKMYDLHYLDDKKSGTHEWRRYAKMTLKERYSIYLKRKRSV